MSGGRQDSYGHPAECFGAIAELVSAYLKPKLREPVTAVDVAFIMMMVKIGRERDNPGVNNDNLVDIAGYARTLEMIYDDEA